MNEPLVPARELTLCIEPSQDGRRVDQALAAQVDSVSRSTLQGLIRDGRVTVNGATVAPKARVAAGDSVWIGFPAVAGREDIAEDIALNVLFEDDDILVIDKPASLVVHPGAGNPAGTMMNALLHHDPALAALPRAGIVHRLDKDTSGVLVVARNAAARTALVEALADRRVHRVYQAVCAGVLIAGGTVDAPIGRHRAQRVKMAVTGGGREAVSHYRVRERFDAHTLVEVSLETGRTHQIRVHMAHIGHPLVGDRLYAGRGRLPGGVDARIRDAVAAFPRQALHAWRLRFDHPRSGEPVTFRAPLPADLKALLETLRGAVDEDG